MSEIQPLYHTIVGIQATGLMVGIWATIFFIHPYLFFYLKMQPLYHTIVGIQATGLMVGIWATIFFIHPYLFFYLKMQPLYHTIVGIQATGLMVGIWATGSRICIKVKAATSYLKIYWNCLIRQLIIRWFWIWQLTHFRLNRLSHTIYWKSPISILGTYWL